MKGKKILVATDLSQNAAPAARWALDLSERLGLPLALVHVLDITVKSWKGEFDVLADQALRKRALGRLTSWFEDQTGRRPDEVILDVGSPAERILRACEEHEAAVLVLSMSGKGAWDRFIFGSTALKLTHDPPCPLVIVHPDHGRLGEEVRLAVGTDFEQQADKAVVFAGELARGLGAKVDLVHAHPLPSTTVILDTELPSELRSTSVVHWAKQAMERFAEAHTEDLSGVEFACHTITDHPVRGLLEFVDQQGVDILVMGHYKKGTKPIQPMGRQRMGSVMVKTAQQMRTTMIIVPA